MEGGNGSSLTLIPDSGGAIHEGQAWLCAHLGDQDDPLLDLNDDREPLQTDNRLLFGFESTDDATECEGFPKSAETATESGTVSSEMRYRDYSMPTTAAADRQLGSDSFGDRKTGQFPMEGSSQARSKSDGGSGIDFFGSDDPTFLNTSLPFFPPRQSEMDVHLESGRAFSDSSHAVCKSSPLKPSTSATLSRLHAQQRSLLWNGTVSSCAVRPVNETEKGLPDVALRQTPLLSQSHSHSTQPATTATGKSAAATCKEAGIASSSPVSGFVIDYSHKADVGDCGHMTNSPENAYADFPQNMMLASFPPPSLQERATGGVAEASHYGPQAVEIHCHSATNRHAVNDKLARQQLLIVLVLCVLFMIGETVGKWSLNLFNPLCPGGFTA